jgi:ABC-type multidrug transport system fused ATPase/permease subunit
MALKGVSFIIPQIGSVTLVGESSSAKSTILKLLYRFYDLAPSDGAIRIDGQDIRDVTQVRQHLAGSCLTGYLFSFDSIGQPSKGDPL